MTISESDFRTDAREFLGANAERRVEEKFEWGKGSDKISLLEEKTPERIIDRLTALVAGDMALVNQTILSRTGSDVTMIPEVANHLFKVGQGAPFLY